MTEQPQDEATTTGGTSHPPVPLEVLEEDEAVPPRPEETAADLVDGRRSEPTGDV